MLFDPSEHMKLTSQPWSADLALQAANSIFDFLCEGKKEEGWPAQASEESEIPFNKSIYYGAAGTLWALSTLSQRLKRDLPFDEKQLIGQIYGNYRKEPDTGSLVPSFMLGESGILLLHHKLCPSAAVTERLRTCVQGNVENPVNEMLWGSPGTMLAALATGQSDLYLASASYLFDQWTENSEGCWIWTQDLYGKKRQFIGAGHGFFGNVQALLKGCAHLSALQQRDLLERTAKTVIISALREKGLANWNPYFGTNSKPPLVQWCHGAPGAIISLSSFPKDYSNELEKVLIEAGELIWKAGPLDQGAALCHGTDGNGFALLRLFERTQDERWLGRARKFAMHATRQRNGRFTLWTGEAGLALFLTAAVDASAGFPCLD